MKAEYKKTKTGDGLPLTIGKMYDVLDVKAGKGSQRLEEIKVKNDLGQEEWYKANKFILHAEAVAYMSQHAAAGGAQYLAQPATYIGMDTGTGRDGCWWGEEITRAASTHFERGFTATEMIETVGKPLAEGITAALLEKDEKMEKKLKDAIKRNMMYGA